MAEEPQIEDQAMDSDQPRHNIDDEMDHPVVEVADTEFFYEEVNADIDSGMNDVDNENTDMDGIMDTMLDVLQCLGV